MRAPIMRCDDLDVLDGATAIAFLVLDANIRELYVSVVVRQFMFPSPSSDDIRLAFGGSSTVSPTSIVPLQKPLIL
jgi:hypothetical protein